MFDPLNPPPPNAPLCLLGQFVWRISIPRRIFTCVPNLVPIGPAVSHISLTFEFMTPTPPPPPNIEGQIVFGLCPFPDESADVYQIWCKSVQPFGSFSRIYAKLVRLLATGRAVSRKNTPKNNIYTSKIVFPARTCSVTNFLHSNFRSVWRRARGGVNDMLSACKN